MSRAADGKIGWRELMPLIILVSVMVGVDITPVLLFKIGKNATWLFPLVWGVVMIIPLLALLSLLRSYQDKGLIEIIYQLTGKYLGFILGSLLFLISLNILIRMSSNYVQETADIFLFTSPDIEIYLLLIGTAYFIAKQGFEVIGRVSSLLFPYMVVAFIILVLLAQVDFIYEFLYPLGGPGVMKIIKSSVTHISLVMEFILLATFFPFVNNYKDYRRSIFGGLSISMLVISLTFVIYTVMFDYNQLQVISHPFNLLIRVTGIARFFMNFDAFFFAFWLMAMIIRFSFYLYLSTFLFARVLKIKEFEPLLLPFATLTIIMGLMPENPVKNIEMFKENLLWDNVWWFLLVLPLILWGIAYLKGELKQ
ncbi:GerAB/ArcD/ProY family transporter [Orenia marismortui]|uniref:Spore germination protein (Amino acid permease) n=1 Tax=Orenia marismortui TaxID=46469 RepID=A0A4R8GQG1_9FIRM|nr:GerAB/ArcD/ProY family transporter [Orenia marismortui]TDX48035.1 spore germination protein (amino acid permease) [Orenia marismortui]